MIGALQWTRAWDLVEAVAFDYLSVRTAADVPGIPVTVVGIDEESFAEIGEPWPWPRSLHGKLLQKVKEAGASVVVFDIVFAEAGAAREDQEFADAIRRHGGAVLAGDISYREDEKFRRLTRVEPHPRFRAAGSITGYANVEVDDDQVVRRMPGDPQSLWRAAVHAYTGGRAPGTPPAGALIRYRDFVASFDYVSYYQALDPAQFLPPGAFEGRIVMVGLNIKSSAEPSQRLVDSFATPFTRMTRNFSPGVEVQAQIISTALKRDWITPLRWWQAGLCNVLLIVFAAWFMLRWHPLRSAAYAALLMAMALASSWGMFEYAGYWWPPVGPVAAIASVWLVRGGTAYLEERQRRLQIKRAFAQYVAPAVVEEISAHPESLTLVGQRREITVMFGDLAGFTALAESMDPEAVVRILNRCLSAMTKVIHKHEGTVDKFIGDAVMAFWGAPMQDDEQAARALDAAIEMQRTMRSLNAEFDAMRLPSLRMRIGINTGTVIVGNMGSEDRFNYTVIGDAANLASRIEGANEIYKTGILFSHATAKAAGNRHRLRPVDRVRVKGRQLPVDLFTVADTCDTGGLDAVAIQAYRNRDWDEAARIWTMLQEKCPGDSLAELYLLRISTYKLAPPAADWDGVLNLDKK